MSQHMEALARANEFRLGRGRLAVRVREGELTLREALGDPLLADARLVEFAGRAVHGRHATQAQRERVPAECARLMRWSAVITVGQISPARLDEFCDLMVERVGRPLMRDRIGERVAA